MTEEEMIENDPDFIASKRFEYSLKKLKERYPEECPDRVSADVLLIEESEVEEIYQRAAGKLRSKLRADSL